MRTQGDKVAERKPGPCHGVPPSHPPHLMKLASPLYSRIIFFPHALVFLLLLLLLNTPDAIQSVMQNVSPSWPYGNLPIGYCPVGRYSYSSSYGYRLTRVFPCTRRFGTANERGEAGGGIFGDFRRFSEIFGVMLIHRKCSVPQFHNFVCTPFHLGLPGDSVFVSGAVLVVSRRAKLNAAFDVLRRVLCCTPIPSLLALVAILALLIAALAVASATI